MPSGTYTVDSERTFATCLLMSVAPKPKFGDPSGTQDTSADGTPKFMAQAAVTFHADNGMSPVSDVLQVTVTTRDLQGTGLPPGTPVVFDELKVGVSTPERRENGTVRGGRMWHSARGLRPVGGQPVRKGGE
jgi:hypothetical protein